MHFPAPVIRVGLRAMRTLFESDRVGLDAKRRLVDVIAGATTPPPGCRFSLEHVAGLPVHRVHLTRRTRGTLIYLHGGGYALGSAKGYRSFVAQIADAAAMDALVPEYSLAPESPHPTALREVARLYEHLLDDGLDPASVVIAGDSAGGGLTMALALDLRDRGLPLPAGLGLISPWLDLARDIDRRRSARRDPLMAPSLISEWAVPYVGSGDPQAPAISPVYGDLAGLPQVVVHSSGDDPIAVDADRLHEQFVAQGWADRIRMQTYENLWHVLHLQHGFLSAADTAVAEFGAAVSDFVRDA